MPTVPTPAMVVFEEACHEAVEYVRTLSDDAKARGLAVALDIGVSAAFLFTVDDEAYTNATAVIRELLTKSREEAPPL